jgi:cell division protein FtsL
VIASQAVRLVSASPRRAVTRRRPQALGVPKASDRASGHRRAGDMPRRREAIRRAVTASSWDLRIFGSAIAAIVLCFALAVVYVSQMTALSVAGYEAQQLGAQRDELRRQNSLLEVQSARLDSPARIAADAQRLGMVRARYVPVIPAQPLIAKR